MEHRATLRKDFPSGVYEALRKEPDLFSYIVYLAAKRNHKRTLEWIETKIPGPCDYAAGLAGAIVSGNDRLFDYFYRKTRETSNPEYLKKMMRKAVIKAIQKDRMEYFDRIYREFGYTEDFFYELLGASKAASVNLIVFFVAAGGHLTLAHFEIFCRKASHDEMRLLLEHVKLGPMVSVRFFALRGAIIGGNMELREEILKGPKLSQEDLDFLFNEAISIGSFEDALCLHGRGARVTEKTRQISKQYGQDDILLFIE